MNKWLKIGGLVGAAALMVIFMLGVVTVVLARGAIGRGHDFRGERPFGRGGFDGPAAFREFDGEGFWGRGHDFDRRGNSGEVTAIDDTSLTIQSSAGVSVTVTVDDNTRVMLLETQQEGSLSDIAVGDTVMVRGRRGDDDQATPARAIVLLPKGDQAAGRVTDVVSQTITIAGVDGETTINTTADTDFRVGRNETGELADVAAGRHVLAFGQAGDDGALTARLVLVHDRGRDGGRHAERGKGGRADLYGGEVTAIDGDSFTLESFWDETSLTVTTDDNTSYQTRGDETLSLADLSVGSTVLVKGRPVEGQANTIKAEVVGIKQ